VLSYFTTGSLEKIRVDGLSISTLCRHVFKIGRVIETHQLSTQHAHTSQTRVDMSTRRLDRLKNLIDTH